MIFQPIISGTQLPELSNPGTAEDLLEGKQLIDQYGNPLTGTIQTNTDTDISVSGPTITIPSGYYDSQMSKSVATATQATPSISVSSSGLITASSSQTTGYVSGGTTSATRQLTTQAGRTITPSTSQQTAVASGRYTTGNIYVAGDSDLIAKNIKSGVNIFGVTGSYEGFEKQDVNLSSYEQGWNSDRSTFSFSLGFTPTEIVAFWIEVASAITMIQNASSYTNSYLIAGWSNFTYGLSFTPITTISMSRNGTVLAPTSTNYMTLQIQGSTATISCPGNQQIYLPLNGRQYPTINMTFWYR